MLLLSPVMTKSGWVFGAAAPWKKGDALIGYPMYYPHADGTRQIDGRSYHKFLRRLPEEDTARQQPYPEEPRIDPWSCRIPGDQIMATIDVISAFQEWLEKPDPRKAVLTRILREAAIPMNAIGIGGSTSLGCQESDADIDVLIFGTAHAPACIGAIEQALLQGRMELMSGEVADAYAKRYGDLYGLAPEYLHHVFAQDLTKVYVEGKKISFIFSYAINELDQIPTTLYRETRPSETCFRARVVSSVSSWYYPRKYLVQTPDGGLHTIWSHHWLHKAMAPPGMLVEVVADRLDEKTSVLTKMHHRIFPLHG